MLDGDGAMRQKLSTGLGFTKEEMIGFLGKASLARPDFKIVSHVETDKKGGGHPLKLFVASGIVPSHT